MGEILWEETGPKARLKATVARYETAMRAALRLLGAPMFPSVGGNDVRDILRATLSDQPAVNSMAFTRGDGDRALDCLIKNMRTTPADQPAAEPAESKLETLLRMRHDLRQEHEKLFTHSWAICTDEQKSYYATCKDLSRVDAAILDAQPAESKLEAIRRLAATLNLNPDLHSAALTDVGKENRKISEAILAILDAQPSTTEPSTPEPKGKRK